MDATDRPRLVFIHGTSGQKRRKQWLKPLNQVLQRRGIAPWDKTQVLSVKYERQLGEAKDSKSLRSPAQSKGSPDEMAECEANFEQNRAELSQILANRGTRMEALGQDVPGYVSEKTLRFVRSTQFRKTAKRYPGRRQRVRKKVLHDLDRLGPGDLIVIGYSLGSVVAADLLPWLRPDQHVRLLVTIGSPLGAGAWNPTVRNLKNEFPYDRLDAWVNIHNRRDWATGRRGLEPRIPEVIDVRIGRFPKNPKGPVFDQHKVGGYARHAALADAIEWATSGARVKSAGQPVEPKAEETSSDVTN